MLERFRSRLVASWQQMFGAINGRQERRFRSCVGAVLGVVQSPVGSRCLEPSMAGKRGGFEALTEQSIVGEERAPLLEQSIVGRGGLIW